MSALPEDLSLARYFLFDRLAEGLGTKVAIRFGDRSWTVRRRSPKDAPAGRAPRGARRAPRRARAHRAARRAAVRVGVLRDARARRGRRDGQPARAAGDLEYLVEYTRATAVITMPEVAERLRAARRGAAAARCRRCSSCPTSRPATDPEAAASRDVALAAKVDRARARARRGDAPAELAQRPPRRPRDLALHVRLDRRAEGERPHAPRLRVQHRGLREAHRRLPRGRRHRQRAAALLRLRDRHEPDVPVRGRRDRRGSSASGRRPRASRTRSRSTGRPSSPTCRRCSASSSSTTTSSRRRGKPGLDLSSVRFPLSAGEALPAPLLARCLERFASDVYDGIGSAEMFHIYARTAPATSSPARSARSSRATSSASSPRTPTAPGATPCAPGEIGVLWVKGDSVRHGYFQDRDKSWTTFHGHWCRTGDLFRIDEEGYLWFAAAPTISSRSAASGSRRSRSRSACSGTRRSRARAVIGAEDEGLIKPKAFVVLARAAHAARRRALADRAQGAREGRRSRSTSIRASSSSSTTCRRTIAARSTRRRSARARQRGSADDGAPRSPSSRTRRSRALLRGAAPAVALVPVGSVEPHGPHLPLDTDTMISETCARARRRSPRGASGVRAVVAPSRAVRRDRLRARLRRRDRVPAAALTALLRAIADGLLDDGLRARLPRQQPPRARARRRGPRRDRRRSRAGAASVACPLTRRWGRTLSDEFKSGACHAGRYETSLVLAARRDVKPAFARSPALGLSLSDAIKAGKTTFAEIGMTARTPARQRRRRARRATISSSGSPRWS